MTDQTQTRAKARVPDSTEPVKQASTTSQRISPATGASVAASSVPLEELKVAIVSNTGNAGKTTIGAHLLYPRLPGASYLAVETINQSAKDIGIAGAQLFKGSEFGELLEELTLASGAVIADIGASNIEATLEAMADYKGAMDEFNLYVVPVLLDQKSQIEAVRILRQLRSLDVPAARIRLLPNRVTGSPKEAFAPLFERATAEKLGRVDPEVYIPESEVFAHLAESRLQFADLLDGQDYRALARAEPDREKAREYASRYRWSRVAENIHAHLDGVFARLVG